MARPPREGVESGAADLAIRCCRPDGWLPTAAVFNQRYLFLFAWSAVGTRWTTTRTLSDFAARTTC